jgi:hypothetical protein
MKSSPGAEIPREWREAFLRRATTLVLVMAIWALSVTAQQIPDKLYQPPIAKPAYAVERGPVVCVDEAHTNFHTLGESFWAFGELVRRDGYITRANKARFAAEALRECAILVIANAQPGSPDWNSYPYPTPSAFTKDEVSTVRTWVGRGGALLLIADHLPLAGAAAELAAAFGLTFTNGFAIDRFETPAERDAAMAKPTIFSVDNQTLRAHSIIRGRNPDEAIKSVRSFTGQAFQAIPGMAPLLVFPEGFSVLMPEKAWQFGPDTRRIPAGGWLQGGVMPIQAGRVAVFGEAAMFSAQVAGPNRLPIGMNAPMAEQNHQFALNVMHWLSGLLQ